MRLSDCPGSSCSARSYQLQPLRFRCGCKWKTDWPLTQFLTFWLIFEVNKPQINVVFPNGWLPQWLYIVFITKHLCGNHSIPHLRKNVKLGPEFFPEMLRCVYCTHRGISPCAGCGTERVSSWVSTVKGVTERDELLEVREVRLRVISVRPRVVGLGRSLSFSSAASRSICLYLHTQYKTRWKSLNVTQCLFLYVDLFIYLIKQNIKYNFIHKMTCTTNTMTSIVLISEIYFDIFWGHKCQCDTTDIIKILKEWNSKRLA